MVLSKYQNERTSNLVRKGEYHMSIYGYTRISTKKQNIERQVRNILAVHPDAIIVREVYTGTKFQGRKELDKILKLVKPTDTIVFDSVSRMSRNAEEGYAEYEKLFRRNITLEFLKEPHINTEVYKKALSGTVAMTGTNADYILEGVNKYLLALAKEQIQIAFNQAEKEVQDLHQRTREGIETARLNGKQIGGVTGKKLTTKKSIEAKEVILKNSKDFNGANTDIEVMKIAGISRNSYYKYKRELVEELKAKEGII